MKLKQKIVVTIFVCCLLLPNLAFLFLKPYVDTTNYEKRELAPKPVLSIENWRQFPQQFENYANDHAAFKNQFVKLNTLIDLNLFRSVKSDLVLLGKHNWLFYKSETDGNPIADYRGTNLYTEQQLKQIAETAVQVNDHFKSQGKEFVLLMIPNKEQIYAEYMPDHIHVESEERRVDQVVRYLNENTDVRVVYPKNELEKGKEIAPTYYKYDTHWNYFGGFIGLQALMEELKGSSISPESVQLEELSSEAPRDMADAINLGKYCNDSPNPMVQGYREDVKILTSEETEDAYYIHKTSTAEDPRSIYVIRDSFSMALFDFLPREFATTTFAHRNTFDPATLKEENPDIVVYQIAERYTDRLLDHLPVLTQS